MPVKLEPGTVNQESDSVKHEPSPTPTMDPEQERVERRKRLKEEKQRVRDFARAQVATWRVEAADKAQVPEEATNPVPRALKRGAPGFWEAAARPAPGERALAGGNASASGPAAGVTEARSAPSITAVPVEKLPVVQKCNKCGAVFPDKTKYTLHRYDNRDLLVEFGHAVPVGSQFVMRISKRAGDLHCPLCDCRFQSYCHKEFSGHLTSVHGNATVGVAMLKEGCVEKEGVWHFKSAATLSGLEAAVAAEASRQPVAEPTIRNNPAPTPQSTQPTPSLPNPSSAANPPPSQSMPVDRVQFKAQLEKKVTEAILAEYAKTLEAPGPALLADLEASQERIGAIMAYHKETLKRFERVFSEEVVEA
ncbi:hypothetical protein BJ508DRAFT_380935 [Ascobolus immersus RN42]|uniref:Uncharacterized protein n=1 Tax=Ascobolus immersus RN42 TaxID=1160509 RepID=A0A3N4HIG3_ASCIM|nr:hypothetical protein BJ508DRAFT_380935 [Ascobolus immersus RN42]